MFTCHEGVPRWFELSMLEERVASLRFSLVQKKEVGSLCFREAA